MGKATKARHCKKGPVAPVDHRSHSQKKRILAFAIAECIRQLQTLSIAESVHVPLWPMSQASHILLHTLLPKEACR